MRISIISSIFAIFAVATWSINWNTIGVKSDTVIVLKDEDGNAFTSIDAISPSGNIFLFGDNQSNRLHAINLTSNELISSSMNIYGFTRSSWGIFNGRWTASFNADESKVIYPSGVKILSMTVEDGENSALVTTTNKNDDESKHVLSADMLSDGSKCVYVVGPDMTSPDMVNLAKMIPGITLPEMYIYQVKTKTSVKITQAKGIGAFWTSDGKNIIFERIDDTTRYGEVWMLDSNMRLKRIPVSGNGVTVSNIKDTTHTNQQGSAEAKSAAESPARFVDTFTTGAANLRVVGDSLLVIRNFRDIECEKRKIGKSYAFIVNLKTLETIRIDCLPEKVHEITAIDVIEPGVLAVYAVSDDDVSGIYLVDLMAKQAKLLRSIDWKPEYQLFIQPNLMVRNGAIYAVIGKEIHKLSLGSINMKTVNFSIKEKVTIGEIITIFAPKINPITGDVTGPDMNISKGKFKVEAINGNTGTAIQAITSDKAIEDGDLLVDKADNIVGEVKK